MGRLNDNFGSYIPWATFLPYLGIDVSPGTLPTFVQCPQCSKSRLGIYQDTILNSTWHHCHSCGIQGDLIELASVVWGVSVGDAAVKAYDANFGRPDRPPAQEVYQSYLDVRHATADFVSSSFRNLYRDRSHKIANLCRDLRITRPNRLAGAATVEELSAALAGGDIKRAISSGRSKGYPVGYHTGDEMVIIPFYDLPYRACGFWVTRKAGDARYYQVPVSLLQGPGGYSKNAGIAMLSVLDQPMNPHLDDVVIVVPDASLALKLQGRHMKDHDNPLPMIVSHEGPLSNPRNSLQAKAISSKGIWSSMPSRSYVFWAPRPDVKIIRDAAQVNGRVVFDKGLVENSYDITPVSWCLRLDKRSKPWQEAMRDLLLETSPSYYDIVVAKAELEERQIRELMLSCPTQVREAYNKATAPKQQRKQFSVGSGTKNVFEDGDVWTNGSGELIAPFAFGVDDVLVGDSQKAYRGTVRYQGQEYPYSATEEELENPLDFAADHLMQHGKDRPAYTRWWNRHALAAAVAFSQPRTVMAAEECGWYEKSQQFEFKDFSISSKGEPITEGMNSLIRGGAGDNQKLSLRIKEAAKKSLLAHTSAQAAFWTLASFVGAELLGRMTRNSPTSLAYLADSESFAAVGKLVGMPIAVTKRSATSRTLKDGIRDTSQWPQTITGKADVGRVVASQGENSYAFQVRDELDLLTSQLSVPCHIYRCGSFTVDKGLREVGPRVISRWLISVAERGYKLRRTECLMEAVLEDMLKLYGVDRTPPELELYTRHPKAYQLVRVLHYMLTAKLLDFAIEGFETKPSILYREESKSLFIPTIQVFSVLDQRRCPTPDPLEVEQTLADEGALLEAGPTGWVIKEDWWNETLKEVRHEEGAKV